MKLKFRKSLQACETSDDDELFRNGIFEFNVTKLVAHLRANPEAFPVEAAAVGTLGLTSSNLDEATVIKADLTVPIVLAEIAPARFNVIDGNHRVERARRDDAKTLPSYRVGPDQHVHFLTTAEAYKEYVRYWNGKVAESAKWARHRTRCNMGVDETKRSR